MLVAINLDISDIRTSVEAFAKPETAARDSIATITSVKPSDSFTKKPGHFLVVLAATEFFFFFFDETSGQFQRQLPSQRPLTAFQHL